MAATRRETDPRWGEVVVKEATDEEGRARLRHEAEILDRCRNPGVVELVHHDADGERAVVITRFCGSRTLLDVASLPADQVAALGASLAQTLADLHQLGVSHGNLLAEHVVLTDDGTPVLCSFADAGVAGPTGFDPVGDVSAMTGLLRHLLQPVPTSRWRSANPVSQLLDAAPPPPLGELADGLARHAGPRTTPLRRPPALGSNGVPPETIDPLDGSEGVDLPSSAAPSPGQQPQTICGNEQLAEWFFSDELIDGPTRQFGPQPPRRFAADVAEQPRGWRRLLGVAALAALALVIGAVTVLVVGGRFDPAPAAPIDTTGGTAAEPTTVPDRDAEAVVSMAATTVLPSAPIGGSGANGPPAAGPQPQAPPTPTETVPAGCPTTHDDAARIGIAATCGGVAHAEGNRIVVGSLTWEVGAPGDKAAVADFTCDGWLDAAALDAGGNVFVFDRWAGSNGDAPAGRLVRHVPAARGLEARPAGAGCGVLAVVAGPGDPVLLGSGDLG